MYYPYTAGVAALSHFYFNPLYISAYDVLPLWCAGHSKQAGLVWTVMPIHYLAAGMCRQPFCT